MSESLSSASLYDSTNPAYIYNYIDNVVWDDDNTDIKNWMLSMAGFFDRLKLYTEHITYSNNFTYLSHSNTPDFLIKDVLNKYGIKQYGFWDNLSLQEFMAASGSSGINIRDVKTEIWRRILNNVVTIVKSKGSIDSAKTLLRCHGIDDNSIQIKEFTARQDNIKFGRKYQNDISQMLKLTGSKIVYLTDSQSGNKTVSFNLAFVPHISYEDQYGQNKIVSTFQYNTCSICTFSSLSYDDGIYVYVLRTPGSADGVLYMTSSFTGIFSQSLSKSNIFSKEPMRAAFSIKDTGAVFDLRKGNYFSCSLSGNFTGITDLTLLDNGNLLIGSVPIPNLINTEIYVNNISLYTNRILKEEELKEHSLNYKSISENKLNDITINNFATWYLQDNKTNIQISESLGFVESTRNDSKRLLYFTASAYPGGVPDNENVSETFIWPNYSYLQLPADCTTANKVRINDYNSLSQSFTQNQNYDYKLVCVELNLIDRINEFLSSLITEKFEDNLNYITPLNRYQTRYTYEKELEIFLTNYMIEFPKFQTYNETAKWFDQNFMNMLKQVTPINVLLLGGQVIENPSSNIEKHVMVYEQKHGRSVSPPPPDGFGGKGETLGSWYNNIGYNINDIRYQFNRSPASNPGVHQDAAVYSKQRIQNGEIKSIDVGRVSPSFSVKYRLAREARIDSDKITKISRPFADKDFMRKRSKFK